MILFNILRIITKSMGNRSAHLQHPPWQRGKRFWVQAWVPTSDDIWSVSCTHGLYTKNYTHTLYIYINYTDTPYTNILIYIYTPMFIFRCTHIDIIHSTYHFLMQISRWSLQVVKRDGRALRYAPPVFRKDRDVPRWTGLTRRQPAGRTILLGISTQKGSKKARYPLVN